MICPTTRLRASSTVSITQCHTITQCTSARIIYTHTAMNKCFCFYRTLFRNIIDVFHIAFSRKNCAINSKYIMHKDCRFNVCNRHLCRAVNFKLRRNLSSKLHNGRRSNNNRSHTKLFQFLQIFF